MSATAARRDRVIARFVALYGRRPRFLVRAPGRVNLIGEHTDYNGLPVLPFAIERQLWVVAADRADCGVRIASSDERFAPRRYELQARLQRFGAGDWGNYHQAAAHGLIGTLGIGALRGGDFLVDSEVPADAGLSSSAALVVGSMLALLAVAGRHIEPLPLAQLAAEAERYVGTQTGGMDQAACLLGRAGHALRIDFDPLRVRAVPIPSGVALVVCHSLVDAQKSGAARVAYNQRVAECRLACRVLERVLGTRLPRPLAHFGDLAQLFPERSLVDFADLLEQALPRRPLTLDEIAAQVGMARARLAAAIGDVPASATFELAARARHVCGEAERVAAAEAALAAADWKRLGALMHASHASCRDDYAISAPALEELVAAAHESGAYGARLTGAGFGGCTINLVRAADAALFLARMERAFYAPRPAGRGREHAFVVSPSAGASVEML